MKSSCFSVVPVLFNVGVNEEATMAASKLAPGGGLNQQSQEKNNMDNFKTLSEYHRRFAKLNLHPHQTSAHQSRGLSGRSQRGPTGGDHGPKTDELLAKLKVEVQSKKNKNVEILQLAENITRSVGHLPLSFYPFKRIFWAPFNYHSLVFL